MLSVAEIPESDASVKSGVFGTVEPLVSIVMLNAGELGLSLPAASISVTVIDRTPSLSGLGAVSE